MNGMLGSFKAAICLFIESHSIRCRFFCLFGMDPSRLYRIDPLMDVAEIEYPYGWLQMELLGSCHHLLCIYNEADAQVAMWNPSTRVCLLLPPADAEIAHRWGLPVCVYGFGYDDMNEEYVLLRLVQTLEDLIVSAVSIYRSRANMWRRLQGILPYSLVDPRTMGVFLCGRLHWIMRRKCAQDSARVLVAFDIYIEEFEEVELPNLIDNRLNMDLAVLEGCLCLTIHGQQMGIDVWITRDYGLNGSWDRLFLIRDCPLDWLTGRPLAYSQNGGRVLVEVSNGTLIWYNLRTNDVKQFHINGMPDFFNAATCL